MNKQCKLPRREVRTCALALTLVAEFRPTIALLIDKKWRDLR